jgi:hypothetical protein
MPELPTPRFSAQLRRMMLSLACTLPVCGLPAGVSAQSVPAGLRACTAESDSGRRLACYDREMARLSATPAPTTGRAAGPTPAEPDLPSSSATQTPHAAMPPSATSKVTSREPPATDRERSTPRHAPPWKILAGGAPWQVTARVVSLDRWPDAMVLHLDNGQVWRQIGRASGDLSLRTGDSVKIEKHFGSYWLSSRYVSNMQVRREPQ